MFFENRFGKHRSGGEAAEVDTLFGKITRLLDTTEATRAPVVPQGEDENLPDVFEDALDFERELPEEQDNNNQPAHDDTAPAAPAAPPSPEALPPPPPTKPRPKPAPTVPRATRLMDPCKKLRSSAAALYTQESFLGRSILALCAGPSLEPILAYATLAVDLDNSAEELRAHDNSSMAAPLEALLAWNGNVDEPTYSQAMKSPDVKKWIEAIMAKLGMLKGMGTWDDKRSRPSGSSSSNGTPTASSSCTRQGSSPEATCRGRESTTLCPDRQARVREGHRSPCHQKQLSAPTIQHLKRVPQQKDRGGDLHGASTRLCLPRLPDRRPPPPHGAVGPLSGGTHLEQGPPRRDAHVGLRSHERRPRSLHARPRRRRKIGRASCRERVS